MLFFQVASVAVLLGVSIYPDEWGALTTLPDEINEALFPSTDVEEADLEEDVSAPKVNTEAGFNERFNIELKVGDSPVSKDKATTVIIDVKCKSYTQQQNKFSSRCEEIKYGRAVNGALIILITVLGLIQFSGADITVYSIEFTHGAIRSIATVTSVIILYFTGRMLHIFIKEEENIGPLNSHGKTYLGLSVAFSSLLVIGRIGALIADYMGSSDATAKGTPRVLKEYSTSTKNPVFNPEISHSLLS